MYSSSYTLNCKLYCYQFIIILLVVCWLGFVNLCALCVCVCVRAGAVCNVYLQKVFLSSVSVDDVNLVIK